MFTGFLRLYSNHSQVNMTDISRSVLFEGDSMDRKYNLPRVYPFNLVGIIQYPFPSIDLFIKLCNNYYMVM